MKNQYFGDINDYRKYGLLRVLQSEWDGRLLVAWMLTPDDGSRDGGRRSYLEHPDSWMRYDPELFAGLADLLRAAPAPAVSLIERSALLPRTAYYSAIVPDSAAERDAWRAGLLSAARGADLVFLDPDNGIEVRSKPVGRRGSSKYVAWREIRDLWDAGCSILIYQHFGREPRTTFAGRMAAELRAHTGARCTAALRTSHVLYLLAAQERHAAQFREAVARLPQRWGGQIEPMSKSASSHLLMIAKYAIIYAMNKRHRETLGRIFQEPAPASLEWRDIEALFLALGAKTVEGRGSRVRFELSGIVATFHRPHPDKEAKPYQVRDARRFLEQAGIKP